MRVALQPVFADFRPDVVIHETGELAGAPMAVARGIPHLTVAFSGALPEWAHDMTVAAIAPVWIAEGLPLPTMDDVRGDVYLHPFPPSFGQAPSSGVVQPMRVEAVDRDTGSPPPWLDNLGTQRPLVYVTSGTEPLGGTAPWAAIVAALGAWTSTPSQPSEITWILRCSERCLGTFVSSGSYHNVSCSSAPPL